MTSQHSDFLLGLAKLIKILPKIHLPMQDCENCPYNSFLYKSKDCYLCYSSSFLESCFYLNSSSSDKDCADCEYINRCELCYECIDSQGCYNCDFCRDCKNCTDCNFCYDCLGCRNCFGCVGLRKKEYYIFNQKYSKEDYRKKLLEAKRLPRLEIEKKVQSLRLNYSHPPMRLLNAENTFGDYVENAKNCYMAFDAEKIEDCFYVYDEIVGLKDCTDCTHIQDCQFCYNLMSAYQCYNVDSSWWIVNCRDCEYGFCNNGCSNCFGCVNIRRKEYYILNKPYSKDGYFKKTREIKADLGKRGLYGKYLIMDAVELAQTL